MSHGNLSTQLEAALSTEARDRIVDACRTAYFVRGKQYDPSNGDDAQWFGFSVWKTITWLLGEAIREDGQDLGLRLANAGRRFRILAEPFLLAPYPLPGVSLEGIDGVFPYNDSGAGLLASMNLEEELKASFMFPGQVNPSGRIGLVIGHAGSPNRGLTDVWLAQPIGEDEGRICEWGYKENLWRDDDHVQIDGDRFPPTTPVSEPDVAVKTPTKRSGSAKVND